MTESRVYEVNLWSLTCYFRPSWSPVKSEWVSIYSSLVAWNSQSHKAEYFSVFSYVKNFLLMLSWKCCSVTWCSLYSWYQHRAIWVLLQNILMAHNYFEIFGNSSHISSNFLFSKTNMLSYSKRISNTEVLRPDARYHI